MAQTELAYVRTQDAPKLPPPPSEVGVLGWLKANVFSSMSNFSSPGAAAQSAGMIVLTFGILWLSITQLWALIDFTLIQAVWQPAGPEKRDICLAQGAGGMRSDDWFGACYPFVDAKWKQYIYGFYPEEQLWRVNLTYLIGAVGTAWLVIDAVPSRRITGAAFVAAGVALGVFVMLAFGETFGMRSGVQILLAIGVLYLALPHDVGRKWVAAFMLSLYPIISFVLLTGGGLHYGAGFWWINLLAPINWFAGEGAAGLWAPWPLIALGVAALGWAAQKGSLGAVWSAFSGIILMIGGSILGFAVIAGVFSVDFGLEHVDTEQWGGLLVTLVVALSGIVASLPLGVLLALGRRSSLPIIRILSIAFIEFWRGVPLITVLFMSSVMLPLFLPEGTEFDKLLRALIGMMLFASAYMAEVVRGGLQAIPKGQYEGAMALGHNYWQMMRMIVLPQALVLVIPGIVNTFSSLFKDTALVLIIGLVDLLGAVQFSFSDAAWATPVQNASGYLIAAVIFWLFCFGMSRYSMHMERTLRRGHAR